MSKNDYDKQSEYDLDFPPNEELIESEMIMIKSNKIKSAELCEGCGAPIHKCECGWQR